MSRMGDNLWYSHKQPDFEQGPYGIKTVSTRFHPHRPASYNVSIPEESGGYDTADKTFWSCSKFLCVSNRVEIRFKSFSTPIDQGVSPCHTPLHKGQCNEGQWSMQFYIAGWCGSIRLEPAQYGYQYGIEIRVKKKIEHDQNFFSLPYRTPGIHQELIRVTMRVYTGGTGSIRFSFRMDPVRNPAVCDCIPGMHTS
jgi:hypothetical protein